MKAEDKEKLNELRKQRRNSAKEIIIQASKSEVEFKREAEYHAELIEAVNGLATALRVNVEPPNLDPLIKKLESVEILKDQLKSLDVLSVKIADTMGKEVHIAGFRDLWEMIVRQNNKIDKANKEKQDEFISKFADLTTYLNQLTETLKQGQDPTDFKPVRIVIGGDGVPLKFLTNMPSSRAAGGGSSSFSRTTSTISSSLATDVLMNGTTELTPKFAVIDAASSGDNTLVAAVSGKIRVISLFLVSAGTVNVRFESGAGGTALTGQMNLIANTGFSLPFSPVGWFETAPGSLLNLELSGNISVDGSLTYIEA